MLQFITVSATANYKQKEACVMNLDFSYQNPTTIYFGKTAMENLSRELKNYGPTVLLVYGKGAIKKVVFMIRCRQC